MHKGLIALIVVAGICLAILSAIVMKQSAEKAQQKSKKILEDFKTVDKDLQRSTNVIDSANKILYDSLLQSINK
jgi:hypothetical protein